MTRLRPLHSGRERGKRDLSIRRLEQPEIVGAFKRGVHEVTGETLTVPKGELADLDDAVDGFCPIWEHTEERYDWIVAKVADYRRAIAGRETFHRSGGARGFLDWLNLGSPTADWLAMTPEQRREAKASDERRAKAALRKKVEKDLARERGEPALEERIAPELAHAELKRLGLA